MERTSINMGDTKGFLESLKIEGGQDATIHVFGVKEIEATREKIEELQERHPEIKGIIDTIKRKKIFLEKCLLFEGTIQINNKNVAFVNLVRSAKGKTDIREAVNIIFSQIGGHQTYLKEKSAGRTVERYSYEYLSEFCVLDVGEDGKISWTKSERCGEKEKWVTIKNNSNMLSSYPNGVVIENFIEWDDGGEYGKTASYALVYPDQEAKMPIKILEKLDWIESECEYTLGNDGNFRKATR